MSSLGVMAGGHPSRTSRDTHVCRSAFPVSALPFSRRSANVFRELLFEGVGFRYLGMTP